MRRRIATVLLASLLAVAGCNDGGSLEDGLDGTTSTTTTGPDETPTDDTEPDDTEPDDTDDDDRSEHPACPALQAIADLDDEFEETLNDALGPVMDGASEANADEAFEEYKAVMQDASDNLLPPLLDAYEDLEAVVDDDLADEVETVREFTDEFFDDLATASSIEELDERIDAVVTEGQAAGQATLAIDAFSQDTCGIVFGD